MLDGVTTTIHGKGTFAHPSVFEIENRIDLYSDFYMMLTEHFGPPTVVNDWLGETEPSELYIENFGNTRKPISTGWLYIAEERPRIYGLFEICPGLCDARNYRRRKHYEFATAQPEIHECAD